MPAHLPPPDYRLIETMRWEPDAGIRLLDRHLARLAKSAAALGFQGGAPAALHAIEEACAHLSDAPRRLRLLLSADGACELTAAPLDPVPALRPVRLSLERVDSRDRFQAHKTTCRAHYERGYAAALAAGAYELLYLNERDEIAEATRHNVFVEHAGVLYTPPVASGALPGVQRDALLGDPERRAVERPLRLDDLVAADRIFLSNAVRGLLEVTFDPADAPLHVASGD